MVTEEKLKVNIDKGDISNQVEINVEAPSEFSTKAYQRAAASLAKEMNTPGFRKGKVPVGMVEKAMGAGYISQVAFEKSFSQLLVQVSLQEKLEIVEVLKVSKFELLPEKPLTFTATLELRPEVKLGKYKGKKVKAKNPVYDREKFKNKTLDRVRSNMVDYKKIEGRAVKEGDVVTLDFDGRFEDGSEVPGGKVEGYQAILEKGVFLPEFIEKLQGANVGEERDIEVTFPDTSTKEFKGKKAIFKVKLHSIEEKVLPEVNDDFVKKIGIESVDELYKKIDEEMNTLKENQSKNNFETALVEDIVSDCELEVSENMIKKEMDHLLENTKQSCKSQGIEWEDFVNDKNNKDFMENTKSTAKKRIEIDLVLSAIIKAEDIQVDKDSVDKEVKENLAKLGDQYKHLETDIRYRMSIEQSHLRNKVIDLLVTSNEPDWEDEQVDLDKMQ